MKYIDVNKLIAEIKRYKNKADERLKIKGRSFSEEQKDLALQNLCGNLLHFITSLQQEQPKFKVGDTIHKIGENTVFPMTIERIYDGDYVCITEHQQSFINIKFQDDYELVEQEQPEVDLEKEIDAVWNPRFNLGWGEKSLLSINHGAFETIACHFYKLGLNARKKE